MPDDPTYRQKSLTGEFVGGERTCPTCGQTFETTIGKRRHHSWIHGESIATVTITCDHCGKERETYEDEKERLTSGFCQECLENEDLGDAHPSSRERPPEVVEKIADAHRGREIPDHVREAASQGWHEWWENEADQEAHINRLTDAAPNELSKEARQKISETLQGHEVSEETRQKIRERSEPAGQNMINVEATGHTVRSSWEKEVDLMLYEAGLEYSYEPQTFELPSFHYTPDFVIDEFIIEVKGYDYGGEGAERAREFRKEFPEYTYIALGAALPSDIHLSWESRRRLLDLL